MLEGLILGVFLMAADPTPSASVDTTQTSSAANPETAPATAPAETPAPTGAATTEATAPSAAENANQANNRNSQVHCRRGPREIGSMVRRRTCSTSQTGNAGGAGAAGGN